jgi:serine/threonine protein kinase
VPQGIIDRKEISLSDPQIALLFWQILCGVNYMKSAGLLHRDLKPANMTITRDLRLKICDYGQATPFLRPKTDPKTGKVVYKKRVKNTENNNTSNLSLLINDMGLKFIFRRLKEYLKYDVFLYSECDFNVN